MFRGLTTITYSAEDVEAAAAWYAEVLGVEPYFRKDFGGALAYVEFRLGDYSHELGILDRRYAGPSPQPQGGVVAYWAVDDVNAAYERLLEKGATTHLAGDRAGPRVRHRLGLRPVRQRAGRDVQPALPGRRGRSRRRRLLSSCTAT